MAEQFKGEMIPTQEKLDDQEYKEFQEALKEEEKIIKEIDNVFATTSNQEEAEKIVLETIATRMDEAMKKTSVALKVWIDSIKKED
jgi:hypothetical protein